jgi:hypothetical protein
VTAAWAVTSPVAAANGARPWTGTAFRVINLLRDGADYGKHNLNQLDIKLAKRFTFGRYRLRADFDLYNVFNSSWPYTVSVAYTPGATSAWQRPTNVLQHRFFKLGGQISF